ncbi:MAG: T9SS type A sorting domain-containing protein, partial [Candidatus Marinimicrobia bacterium]|nr:T9SS type A sorting domain-containing protein [Candidatus Neomarinimicrobiota bacterium]
RFTWASADGFGWEGFNGAIGWGSPGGPNGFATGGFDEPVPASELKNVLLILASVPDGAVTREPVFDTNDPNVSYAYRYGRGFTDPPKQPEFADFIIDATSLGYSFQDFNKSVPLSAWDVDDPDNPRRLAIGFLENNAEFAVLDGVWFPRNSDDEISNIASDGPREWLWIFDADYSETPDPAWQSDALSTPLPIIWWLTVNRRGADVPFSPVASGDDHFLILANKVNSAADVFTFTTPAPVSADVVLEDDIEMINVFPNPYYGFHPLEGTRADKWVKFNHLPTDKKVTIRIFNLGGVMVRSIVKAAGDGTQYAEWNLRNQAGLPVASGLYIAYIEIDGIDASKILKIAIVQETQILRVY